MIIDNSIIKPESTEPVDFEKPFSELLELKTNSDQKTLFEGYADNFSLDN